MPTSSRNTNAGVHNATGIEFQKHCALHLLFQKYSTIENRKYFICIEHHDDLLFCFQTQSDLLETIEAYQAKKASSPWTMGVDLMTILKKMTQVGLDLNNDPHPKDSNYSHSLTFLTNNSMHLHCGSRTNKVTALINESNTLVRYLDLDNAIRSNILNGLRGQAVALPTQISELDKVSLAYIDLPKQAAGQKDSLVGQFNRIFQDRVNDSTAAVDTLLMLFRDVENVINNGNAAQLMDRSKRVTSDQIKNAIRIITTKVKGFEFWRQRGDSLADLLSIGVFDHNRFKLKFENSFDLFKDLRQTEHQNLLNYVQSNKLRWSTYTDELTCINNIHNSFVTERSTNLSELDIKAAICAAYLEIKD